MRSVPLTSVKSMFIGICYFELSSEEVSKPDADVETSNLQVSLFYPKIAIKIR